MASLVYSIAKDRLIRGQLDLSADPLMGMLVTADYVPNASTHGFRADVTDEITGTGYTAGGKALTGQDVSGDGADVLMTADPLVWAGATFTDVRGLVTYVDTGDEATDLLVSYMDFGSDMSVSGTSFTVAPVAGTHFRGA